MNELLFQTFLDNRASLSNKGRKINTALAIKMLRNKITIYDNEGYDIDMLINRSLEHSWFSIFRHGEPKQKHLTAHKSLSGAIDGFIATTCIHTSNYQQQHDHAKQVRQQGLDEIEKMKRVLSKHTEFEHQSDNEMVKPRQT